MTIRYEANPPKILPDVDTDEAIAKFIEKIKIISKKCDALHLTENVLGHQRVSPIEVGKIIRKEIPNIPITVSLRVRDYRKDLAEISPTLFHNFWSSNIGNVNISAGGNNFVNQTMIHMILNEILSTNKNYVYQYDAFFCGTDGYNITEMANAGDLSYFLSVNKNSPKVITDSFLVDMMKQILTPLSILKRDIYGFVHADLKTKNIFVSLEDDQIYYKIADYDKSSITWRGIRFYNHAYDYRVREVSFPWMDGLEGKYYTLRNTEVDLGFPILAYIMHNPNGFYASHDIYTLFYSLMMEPRVWNSPEVKSKSGKFFELWKSLWYKGDFIKLMSNITKQHIDLRHNHNPLSKKNMLKNMRSIIQINNTFWKEEYKLKLDIDFIYEGVGLKIEKSDVLDLEFTKGKKLHISNDRKICINECKKRGWGMTKSCNTNKFSKLGGALIYDWDYCE